MPPKSGRRRAAAARAKPAAASLDCEQQHEQHSLADDGAKESAAAALARECPALRRLIDSHLARIDAEVDRRMHTILIPLGEHQDEQLYHAMKAQVARIPEQVREMPFHELMVKYGGDMAAAWAAAGGVVASAPAPPSPQESEATAAAASLPSAPAAPRPPLPPHLRAAAAAAFAASPSNPPPRKRVMIAAEPREPREGEREREGGGGRRGGRGRGNGDDAGAASPSSPPRPLRERASGGGGGGGGESAAALAAAVRFETKREPAAGDVFFSANGSPYALDGGGALLRTAARGGGGGAAGLGGAARAFANPVAPQSTARGATFTILKPPGAGASSSGLTRSGLVPAIEFVLASGKRVVVDVENDVFDDAGLTAREAREVEDYLTGLNRLTNVAIRSRRGGGRGGGGGGGSRR